MRLNCHLGWMLAVMLLCSSLGWSQGVDSNRLRYMADSMEQALFSTADDTSRVRALSKLHQVYGRLNLHDQALKISTEANALADSLRDTMGLAYSTSQMAYSHYYLGNYPEALYWNKQAVKHANWFLGTYHRSVSYGNTALLFQEIGEYDSALVYMLHCLELRQALNDTVHLAYTYYDIGQLFLEMGDVDRALSFHQKALTLREQIEDVVDEYNVIEDSYCAVAMAYHGEGNSDTAMHLLNKALDINERKRDVRRKSNTLRSMGQILYDKGLFHAAIEQFENSMSLDKGVGEVGRLAEDHLQLGRSWKAVGDNSKARHHFEQALSVGTQLNTKPAVLNAHLELAEIHELKGSTALALRHQKQAYVLKEMLLDEQKLQAIEEMEVRFETKRKQDLIKELNAQKELADATASLKEAEAGKSRTMLWATFSVLLLMTGISFLVVRSNFQSRKANDLLAQQKRNIEEKNLIIEQSLLQKEALLKEVHHRVKNNLQVISSLLSLQSRELSDESAKAAIRQGQNRVNSIALIHQRLYQTDDMAVVDFHEYATQLLSYLKTTYLQRDMEVDTEVTAQNVSLDIDTAVPLGLILNEMATNSFKHAFQSGKAGRITIRVEKHKEWLDLEYRDDGVGLPSDMEVEQLSSLGMKLVRLLCKQLKGTMQLDGSRGVKMTMRIPVIQNSVAS